MCMCDLTGTAQSIETQCVCASLGLVTLTVPLCAD
uniref:Uncharacterized protein n=1 Tax=Anguilla anguilla TaxID=7936 RepID=A0A0E9RD80_ANGAN